MKEQEYTVKWEIQLRADSPQAAAQKALEWIRSNDSMSHVFTTKDENDVCHSVDLDDYPEDQVVPITFDQFFEITMNNRVGEPEPTYETTPLQDVWGFVCKYYPGYDHSDQIAYSDDIQKILDKEWLEEGSEAHRMLQEDYEGNYDHPQIQVDYDQCHVDIYFRAIEGYLQSLKQNKDEQEG